jgi:SHS2 domain-containing protein
MQRIAKSCSLRGKPAGYNRLMGFEEIAHTADWSVRVWAQDLPGLFAESARAMNALAGTVTAQGPRLKRIFEAEGPDAESLLVAFLSELIYYQEQENLAFDAFAIKVPGSRLSVEMEGAQMISTDKAIKAATYHNLKIKETPHGFETTLVFDV